MLTLNLTAFTCIDPDAPLQRTEKHRANRFRHMSEPSSIEAGHPSDDTRHAYDAQLLRRAGEGDQSALAELYDRWVRPLHSLACNILRDPVESEDILHDAFVTLWQKAADFDGARNHAFTWAGTLVRNRAIERLRSRARRSDLLNKVAPADLGYDEINNSGHGHDSAGHLWLKEKASAVRRALATLPDDQHDALHLAYFGGLTQHEIAEKLSQPLGTVKARIRRGLFKFRDVLPPQL